MLSSIRRLCFSRTLAKLRQSSAPPRNVSEGDALVRWSKKLLHGWPQHQQLLLPNLCVGLEGCTSAFNAMNSIRTCMYFGTATAPCFLSLECMGDIHRLHTHHDTKKEDTNAEASECFSNTLSPVARFGKASFLQDSATEHLPLVALENYTCRSESIGMCRFPFHARFLIGHENIGVSREYLDGVSEVEMSEKKNCYAERVLYVPQYGTISSLNVVTSMGIALFYALLDSHYPFSRTFEVNNESRYGSPEMETLRAYQRCFRHELPTVTTTVENGERGCSRIDQRPIHPAYYNKNVTSIVELHRHLRQLLLQVCSCHPSSSTGIALFGLSVLYENSVDQRSLGGIVRSANAFLVDHVYYFGRRKMNVVGMVGTQHYTPPVYLGVSCEESDESNNESKVWADTLLQRLEKANGAPFKLWFLDCSHAFLYAETFQGDDKPGTLSSAASLSWYYHHQSDADFVLSLCDTEDQIREASQGGIVLLVPQEGVLPSFHLLQRCEKILSLLPVGDRLETAAGLPIAVATGIALQRLSAVMYPQVGAL